MVLEPPLEERLLLLGGIRGLLLDFIRHRVRDLKEDTQCKAIVTPPVPHSSQCLPQIGCSQSGILVEKGIKLIILE